MAAASIDDRIRPVDLPERVVFLTIEPRTKADQEKLGQGLQKLMAEDPTLRVNTDTRTGQTILRGMGELHLEVIVDRLKREFNVMAVVGKAQVAYKETLTRPAEGEGRYVRQTGGRGEYGHVKIRLLPGGPGTGYIFENQIVDGAIPDEFITHIDEGIKDGLTRGVLAGYPVDDVRIELYDGSFHDIDSSETAFKIAGRMAFQDAAKKAEPELLEPVMRVEVVVQKEHTSHVVGDLSRRRGQIHSEEDRGKMSIISASVPLSEMLGYATDVRARTEGARVTRCTSIGTNRYAALQILTIRTGARLSPRRALPRRKAKTLAWPSPSQTINACNLTDTDNRSDWATQKNS
jgi:elongation factor G